MGGSAVPCPVPSPADWLCTPSESTVVAVSLADSCCLEVFILGLSSENPLSLRLVLCSWKSYILCHYQYYIFILLNTKKHVMITTLSYGKSAIPFPYRLWSTSLLSMFEKRLPLQRTNNFPRLSWKYWNNNDKDMKPTRRTKQYEKRNLHIQIKILLSRNKASYLHSHNAISYWNFQNYPAKVSYKIIHWICSVIPK